MSQSNLYIDIMSLSDLEKIKDVLENDFDDFWNYNIFKSELNNPNSSYFVVKDNDLIVGFSGILIVFDEEKALQIMKADAVTVYVDMHEGEAEATAWGCDLTYDYVKINADYRS